MGKNSKDYIPSDKYELEAWAKKFGGTDNHPADLYASRKSGIPMSNSPLCNEAARMGRQENNHLYNFNKKDKLY